MDPNISGIGNEKILRNFAKMTWPLMVGRKVPQSPTCLMEGRAFTFSCPGSHSNLVYYLSLALIVA